MDLIIQYNFRKSYKNHELHEFHEYLSSDMKNYKRITQISKRHATQVPNARASDVSLESSDSLSQIIGVIRH